MLFAMAVGDDFTSFAHAPRLTTFGPMTDQFDRHNASNDAPPKRYYNQSLLSSNAGLDVVQHMCGAAPIPFTFGV
jgi:hypothetical protein